MTRHAKVLSQVLLAVVAAGGCSDQPSSARRSARPEGLPQQAARRLLGADPSELTQGELFQRLAGAASPTTEEYTVVREWVYAARPSDPPSVPARPSAQEVYWGMVFAAELQGPWDERLRTVLDRAGRARITGAMLYLHPPLDPNAHWLVLKHMEDRTLRNALWEHLAWSSPPCRRAGGDAADPPARGTASRPAAANGCLGSFTPQELFRVFTQDTAAASEKWRVVQTYLAHNPRLAAVHEQIRWWLAGLGADCVRHRLEQVQHGQRTLQEFRHDPFLARTALDWEYHILAAYIREGPSQPLAETVVAWLCALSGQDTDLVYTRGHPVVAIVEGLGPWVRQFPQLRQHVPAFQAVLERAHLRRLSAAGAAPPGQG